MVSRLGQRIVSVSLCWLLYPIVQEVVVVCKIGGIQTHEEYEKLSKAQPEAEFTHLQKIQETAQKLQEPVRQCQRPCGPLL